MSAAAQAAPSSAASFARLRAFLAWLADHPALIYASLAVAVAGPLLGRGLVLSVDLAQTPRSPLPSAYWGLATGTNEGSLGRLPFDSLFSLAGSLGVVELTQKALLLSIPFLAGLGMHRLVEARATAARLFAGTLYAVNPFVYDRLVAGQWLLLLGYALLPWCFAAFLAVLRGERAALWRFAVLTGVAGAASAHMAGLLALLCVLTVATAPRGNRRDAGIALALGGAASLLWLIPTPGLSDLWSHVGRAQLDLYATRPDHAWGPVVTVLGMHGFWDATSSAATAFALWPAVPALLLLLAARGFALMRNRRVALAVALAGLLGTLFALGMSTSATRPVTVYLMDHVRPLRSFRDTQKGLALLVFAYAFLGAPAVEELVRTPRRRLVAAGLAVAAVCVPLVGGANELGGAGGTLHTARFPSSWQAADNILARDAKNSRTLFLPFHGYLHLSFAHSRVTYNPAPSYFSTPILSSRSVTNDPALDDSTDAQQQAVTALLANPTAPRLGRCLAALGVSHVLLAHEADWQTVAPIAGRADMRVVARWPDLTLLALRHPGAAAMTAPQDASATCPAGVRPLPSRRLSPTHLRLTAPVPAGRRLVLGVPQPQRWTRSGADVTFSGWPAYRRVYVAGLIGWLIVLVGGGLALAQRTRS